jgi:hypothetical protein
MGIRLNKNLIVFGLTLLLTCWVGNLIYYQNHILKKPLFLKHYYDIPEGMNDFWLYYIQNINDKSQVSGIRFPNIDNQYLYVTEYDEGSDNRYYKLKKLYIKIYDGDIKYLPKKYRNRLITKARIEFSDGKVMNVNLGKIYLYNNKSQGSNLESQKGYSSNYAPGIPKNSSYSNSGGNSFIADKDIKVIGISSPFKQEIKDILKIYINGRPLPSIKFPISIKKNDKVSVNYVLNFDKKIIKQNNAYNFYLHVLTEDVKGHRGVEMCFINGNLSSPEDFDINALKNEQGRD